MNIKIKYKNKMKLRVSSDYEKPNPRYIWGNFLIQKIAHSGLFKVTYEHFPRYNASGIPRAGELKAFELNGIMCLVDAWDYSHPTCHISKKFLDNNPKVKNIKYVFKTQYSERHMEQYNRLDKELGIKVFPFFIFPRHNFKNCQFQWKNKEHEHLAFFSGRIWKERKRWYHYMMDRKDDFFSVNHESSKIKIVQKSSNHISEENYMGLMKNTKWGLILKGKGEAGKNRREVEYSSCGMPLALNYKPIYPFNFEPNKHYLYLEKPEDLEKLKTIDPAPYAKASARLFRKYFDPEKVPYNLLKFYGHLFDNA